MLQSYRVVETLPRAFVPGSVVGQIFNTNDPPKDEKKDGINVRVPMLGRAQPLVPSWAASLVPVIACRDTTQGSRQCFFGGGHDVGF